LLPKGAQLAFQKIASDGRAAQPLYGTAQNDLSFNMAEVPMSRFEDTSIMRKRMDGTLIELRKKEMGPQSKARGILTGTILGLVAWFAIVELVVGVSRYLHP
jgi:hypothetical protein